MSKYAGDWKICQGKHDANQTLLIHVRVLWLPFGFHSNTDICWLPKEIVNCAGFETTTVPAGVPTLLAAKTRDSGSKCRDRPGTSMQLKVCVHGDSHRHNAADSRRQVPGDETSQRLLPVQYVFRTGPQLSLQGLPQLPVRHHPRVRQIVIKLVWYFSRTRPCHTGSVWDTDSCLAVQWSELLTYQPEN